MSQSRLANREKEEVNTLIEQRVGPTRPVVLRRPDWRVTRDRSIMYFLTFSREDQRFYDVNENDLAEWLQYERSFVVLVMGSARDTFIIPVSVLARHLKNQKPKQGGNFKLHIIDESGKYKLRELGRLDLSEFHNNYAALTP